MPAEGDEMHASPDFRALAQNASAVLSRLRAKSPRVHCITNSVAQAFTANVLLAAGAQPSMTISPEEVGHFAGSADALLVNLGTFDRERARAIDIAVAAATAAGRPWVLDPVLIDRSPPRAELARELLERRPAAMRLNTAEFATLRGENPAAIAAKYSTIVALSAATDVVASGDKRVSLSNGHLLMARVTAMGCAGSALIAACLAVEEDPWLASVAGMLILSIAGEIAGGLDETGPGSFAVSILDQLYRLEPDVLVEWAQVS
jgi:hydroxyethylthiazole kinase